jgi:hypothetical protein
LGEVYFIRPFVLSKFFNYLDNHQIANSNG